MRIVLIGYGKMGKAIEQIARKRAHDVVHIVNRQNTDSINQLKAYRADVVIEFTTPESALSNICQCLQQGIPTVSGTTGWLAHLEQVKQYIRQYQVPFFYAPNFSIGVNLFFMINRYVARVMAQQADYEVSLQEIHHIHKKDAPSGTALRLAEDILQENPKKTRWALAAASTDDTLAIQALREGEVAGIHTVYYRSTVDQIELRHEAFNRQGFAIGAVQAAEFLIGKPAGLYGMENLLQNHMNGFTKHNTP